jgi:4-amino-4-deoxy-L-arabinose transferase-like glycosyltransferase
MPRYRVIISRVLLAASLVGLTLLHLLEPSYDPNTRTLSEYALSPSGWVFTLSMLSMAPGSALVLGAVWSRWLRRRWLLVVWVIGLVVVAVVPTDPGGAVTSVAGAVHAVAATLAIFALLIAEVATAVSAGRCRLFSGACALVVVAGLALSPLFGFGTGERVAVVAHIGWLLGIAGNRPDA